MSGWLLLSALAFAQSTTEPPTVRVCGTVFVDDCYQSVQEAVDAATVVPIPEERDDVAARAFVIEIPGGDYIESVRVLRDPPVRFQAIGTLRPRLLGTLTVNGAKAVVDGLDIVGDPALIVQDGEVVARDVRWAAFGIASRNRGGVVRLRDSSLVLSDARLADGGTETAGGLLSGTRSTFVGQDIEFVGGFADDRGGAIQIDWSEMTLRRSTFQGASAPRASAMYLFQSSTTLSDVRFDARTEAAGASVVFALEGSLSIRRATMCGGHSGGSYVWARGATVDVRNSVLSGVNAVGLETLGGEVDARNNHFVDLASLGTIDSPAVLADNLVLQSGAGAAVGSFGDEVALAGNHWEHDGLRFELDGSQPASQRLAQIAPPTERCPDVGTLLPPWTSPLRDGGTGSERDPDGSRVDIGAFGGPEAAGWGVWGDADADGWPDLYDCEPRDPTVYPGAVDRPDDGRDQDCDGEDRSVDDLVVRRCAAAPGPLVGWALVVLALVRRRRLDVRRQPKVNEQNCKNRRADPLSG